MSIYFNKNDNYSSWLEYSKFGQPNLKIGIQSWNSKFGHNINTKISTFQSTCLSQFIWQICQIWQILNFEKNLFV